ncbi:MAG TPA: glycosyltransferase family 2 protein [Candidatus Omnitrophota bacterium]|nr:glycosyltransferase family 2 protein [Candidatus Omnitrophota bacterium]
MSLTAIVLTKNEERNIGDCLAALSFSDELLVVDSGSTDKTREIARSCGASVIEHPMKDFADQRNFAMEQAKGDWVLFVDADERVTPELADEIKNALRERSSVSDNLRGVIPEARNLTAESEQSCPADPAAILCVYAIPRRTYFFGRPLFFCDARGDAPIRLLPRWYVSWTQPVHEKIRTDLPCRSLKNLLFHYSTRDLDHYREKVAAYIPLELEAMRKKGRRPSLAKVLFVPPAKFVQLYFWKLGVLDGVAGFQYAILSAYYTFVKHWRYWRHE